MMFIRMPPYKRVCKAIIETRIVVKWSSYCEMCGAITVCSKTMSQITFHNLLTIATTKYYINVRILQLPVTKTACVCNAFDSIVRKRERKKYDEDN